jgi:hypothetical protein
MRRILKSSFFLLLLLPGLAFASVEITHVEYDVPGSDEGHEWVEIANKGVADADLANLRFLEGGVKHKLTLAQGSWALAPGASAAIVTDPSTFLADHPGFSKSIYKSSFSLSNTGETLALVNASGTIESSLSYKGTPTPPKAAATKMPAKSSAKTSAASPDKQAAAAAQADLPTFAPQRGISSSSSNIWIWYAGLAGILALGVGGVVLARPFGAQDPETKGDPFEFKIES